MNKDKREKQNQKQSNERLKSQSVSRNHKGKNSIVNNLKHPQGCFFFYTNYPQNNVHMWIMTCGYTNGKNMKERRHHKVNVNISRKTRFIKEIVNKSREPP